MNIRSALTGTATFMVAVCVLVATAAAPALARDINLGGTRIAPDHPTAHLAPNIVELPTIEVSIRKDDGGWRHIKIDAWLAPKDLATAHTMDGMKTSIVKKAGEDLPGNRGFDVLKSAHEGNQAAKEVLHDAAAQSLGHPWEGEVLIRNLLVY